MNPSYAIIYIIDAHQFSSLFTTGKRRISAHNRAIGRSGVPQEAQDDALSDGISADRQMPLLRPHRRPCCHGDSIPTRLCLKNDDFFSPRFKSPSEKAFTPDRCEGGWLWLKKTDNICWHRKIPPAQHSGSLRSRRRHWSTNNVSQVRGRIEVFIAHNFPHTSNHVPYRVYSSPQGRYGWGRDGIH